MKNTRFIMAFAAGMLFFANSLWAYDFSAVYNGTTIYYNITSNSSPYSVEVTYRTTSYSSYSWSVTIPDTVTYNGITYSVTSIGRSAFNGCTGLTSVTIPNTVTSIGTSAFAGCAGLTSVTIPDFVSTIGSNAFNLMPNINYHGNATGSPWGALCINGYYADSLYYTNSTKTILCSAHKQIHRTVISDSVTSIGSYAFYKCAGLTSVTIPNSVTSIGSYAFYECAGLTRTNYTGTIVQWCDIDFDNDVATPIVYSRNLYINNQLVTNLVIPNTVDTIKQYAFLWDTCITTVTIPNSVTSIGISAISNCSGLTSIIFRRANTTIGNGNFYNVPAGAQIHIPCGSSAWYISRLQNLSNFIEELQYTYSVISQDTIKGTVATITAPTCNTPSWTISATANTGYTFSRWSDGNTQNPRILTVTQDTALVAYFTGGSSPQWYRFSVVSEDTLKGTVQIITQPSQSNPQATFVALPNTGYTFSHWSDGNTQNPRTLTVTQDTVLVACFTSSSQQWYNFNVVSEDVNKGTVQCLAQPSQSNPQATFVALPNTGFTFSRWSDGNTQNPRSITVTQDTILIAFFTSNQGIAEVENAAIRIYPNPANDKVTLEGVGNEDNIFIINTVGKIVKCLENAGGIVTFSVGDLPKGIYFVRVGGAVRKLIVE